MTKTILLTAIATLFAAAVCGQVLTAREQTVLHIFGRLNLEDEPIDNLNYWTDGGIFWGPYFFDVSDFDNKPRADGDTIYFFGGTLHEGGYAINVLLAADGRMTIAEKDVRFNKGDRVEYRIIDGQPLLLFSDVRTGAVKDVLKQFDGNLYERYIDNYYRYFFAGSFSCLEVSGEPITFNRQKSTVSGLLSKGETAYQLINEFGDTPVPVLQFDEDVIYKANRKLTGIELIPLLTGSEIDIEWTFREDKSKPVITLLKTAEGQPDLPPGRFPLASTQVMTLTELYLYAGKPLLSNLKIMRNEIFARYGYKFKTNDMADFFGTQSWYNYLYDDVTSKLTEIERINIALIQVLEKTYAGYEF
jgi:hypothetical protein